jgi:hypothetical protein
LKGVGKKVRVVEVRGDLSGSFAALRMTAKTGNGRSNSGFLHCDAHGETVSIFGRNDGIGR